MELQFQQTVHPCLQQVKWEVRNCEQTQEVRIGDEMPDVGTVLGAWGQVILRGKQWHSSDMQVSAGVMAWVLYSPEGGGEPQCVETWIPMQLRWDLPDTGRDGTMIASCVLRSVDARCVSSRRLLVRAGVGVLAEAVTPGELTVCEPEELPEDVQLLKSRYPVELPAEAGEKPFSIEEELSGNADFAKPVYYTLQPRITESKVLAGKVAFRGTAQLHLLYMSDDGQLGTMDTELPFSHYAELERDYDQDATARFCCQVTGLELGRQEDGKWCVKAGLTAQYVIHHRPVIQVVEDAYSLHREAQPSVEEIPVAAVLDSVSQTVTARQTVQEDVSRVIDLCVWPDHGILQTHQSGAEVTVPGVFQLLYEDPEGNLQSMTAGWEENWDLPASKDSKLYPSVSCSTMPQATVGAGTVTLSSDLQIDALTVSGRGIRMVKGLHLGQEEAPDPDRPSLVLCRCAGRSLWEIAKDCRTTVEAICQANAIDAAQVEDTMLLIPIP